MTTAAEIKRWTKDIVNEHGDLLLDGRTLHLKPIRHIWRKVAFLGSSSKTYPTPTAGFALLFTPPSAPLGNGLGLQLCTARHSTDPGFLDQLAREIRDVLSMSLRRLNSLEAFHHLTLRNGLIWRGPLTDLSFYPVSRAVLLAALGKLPEAIAIADHQIAQADETKLSYMLAEAKSTKLKRPSSSEAQRLENTAGYRLALVAELKQLVALARGGDRVGVGTLLRTWEHQRVCLHGIEHLWEPTPFPVEKP